MSATMPENYPEPDTNRLIQPLLACLPIAFVSPQPPPILLSILSPILRQRVKLLSETRSTTEASWLPLLCWNSTDAMDLPKIIENTSFEAHPVSGEMEFGDIEKAEYRRVDEETLQARNELPDLKLMLIYTWCTNDAEGGEDGWRVSELKPLKVEERDRQIWYKTSTEADRQFSTHVQHPPISIGVPLLNGNGLPHPLPSQDEDDDDDAYWAQYDQRATETPGHGGTPQPRPSDRDPKDEEDDDYYSRYDTVQPSMDAEDPSEDKEAIGDSSLHGNVLLNSSVHESTNSQHLADVQTSIGQDVEDHIIHTRPSSASSLASISKLENSARQQSHAEIAIQQHISSSIKSLYRLTRGAGIDSTEFRRLVENELECLSMMDDQ